MRHLLTSTFLLITIAVSAQSARQQYIDKYKNIAMREMKTHAIPASITLAQGILESGDGRSQLASKSNNHFGIKCHKSWTGGKVYHDDDKKGECFRKYKNPEESFVDHSLFLVGRSRYAALFELRQDDYKGWAKGLQKAGYATSKTYSSKLIKIIEDNNLQQFDARVLHGSDDWLSGTTVMLHENKLKYIVLDKDQNVEDVSIEFEISIDRILDYNDLSWDRKPAEGSTIFLQKKKGKGSKKFHYAAEGETMYEISQKFGIQLSALYKKNKMMVGSQPVKGQKIWLRKTKK